MSTRPMRHSLIGGQHLVKNSFDFLVFSLNFLFEIENWKLASTFTCGIEKIVITIFLDADFLYYVIIIVFFVQFQFAMLYTHYCHITPCWCRHSSVTMHFSRKVVPFRSVCVWGGGGGGSEGDQKCQLFFTLAPPPPPRVLNLG